MSAGSVREGASQSADWSSLGSGSSATAHHHTFPISASFFENPCATVKLTVGGDVQSRSAESPTWASSRRGDHMNSDKRMGGPAVPASRRWIGGANVPTRGGFRVNASLLLAELAIDGDIVELRLRGPLGMLTRAETLRAKPVDLQSVFPIRSTVRFRGVGFRRPDLREYYFKTTRIDDVLDALRSVGFPVSTESQPAAKIWRAAP